MSFLKLNAQSLSGRKFGLFFWSLQFQTRMSSFYFLWRSPSFPKHTFQKGWGRKRRQDQSPRG